MFVRGEEVSQMLFACREPSQFKFLFVSAKEQKQVYTSDLSSLRQSQPPPSRSFVFVLVLRKEG